MNSAVKLGITLVLGVLAGAMNWYVVQSKVSPVNFVRAKKSIKEGEVFSRDMLESVPGDESWSRSVVPYGRRDSIVQLRAPRSYAPGDLVLWRDIQQSSIFALQDGEDLLQIGMEQVRYEPSLLKIGSSIGFVVAKDSGTKDPMPPTFDPATGFSAPTGGPAIPREYEVLGPFRVVTIGSFVRDPESKEAHGFRTIGVAARLQKDESDVWQFSPMGNRLMAASSGGGILSVVLFQEPHPVSAPASPATTAP